LRERAGTRRVIPQEYGLAEALASRLKESVLGASHARARFIEPLDTHPLMTAVHMTFSEHRPLMLSPDIVWVTMAQGLAMHIAAPAGRATRDAPARLHPLQTCVP
jgi:hypothetical protein